MAVPEDAVVTRRTHAMQLLQEVDDGLSTDQKIAIVQLFMKNAVAADTYLSLTDADVRRGWIHAMLDEPLI